MGRFLALLVAVNCATPHVWACCPTSAGPPVWMTHESAIVVWDSKRKIQHFIRQTDFETEAKDFGFIVPVPSVPDFGVAKREAFERLENLVPEPVTFGCAAKTEAVDSPAAGIEVIKTERVGDYQATVLKATDGSAMNAWLKKNGFVSRPQMTEWLDHYSKKQWYFAALKYAATPDAVTNTDAVRISFETDSPHYPYKMPSDAFKPGWVRPLRLYLVASTGIDANMLEAGERWRGEKVWSGDLPKDEFAGLAEDIALNVDDLPKDAVVTVFKNGHVGDDYEDDLAFVAATNWAPWILSGLTVVVVVAWVLTQRNRRRFAPSPA